MVLATEAGQPVDVDFQGIQVFDSRAGAFLDIADASTSVVEQGIYVVTVVLPRNSPNRIFRFQVRHDDVVDHFGEIVFARSPDQGFLDR